MYKYENNYLHNESQNVKTFSKCVTAFTFISLIAVLVDTHTQYFESQFTSLSVLPSLQMHNNTLFTGLASMYEIFIKRMCCFPGIHKALSS